MFDSLLSLKIESGYLTVGQRDQMRSIINRFNNIFKGYEKPEVGRLYADLEHILNLINVKEIMDDGKTNN